MPHLLCNDAGLDYASQNGRVPAFSGIHLQVEPSEFVALIGPSGCGKTSLLRMFAGLLAPTSGTFTRSGCRLSGLVWQQDDGLFPWMTALDNAAFALEMKGVSRASRIEQSRAVLARFGLAGHEHAYPGELSAGMKQRVAVARAFLSGSTLLLMDEPFGALDAITRQTLQTELLEEWLQSRRTVVFVTHDIEEAAFLSSRVLVMAGRPGTIIADFRSPFSWPRTRDLTLTAPFLDFRRSIHQAMCASASQVAAS